MYNFKGWLTKNKLSSVAWAEVAYFPLMSLCPNASVNKLSFRICHMYTCLFGFLSPLFLFLFFFSSLLPFFLITHILSWLLCIFVNTAFLFFFFSCPYSTRLRKNTLRHNTLAWQGTIAALALERLEHRSKCPILQRNTCFSSGPCWCGSHENVLQWETAAPEILILVDQRLLVSSLWNLMLGEKVKLFHHAKWVQLKANSSKTTKLQNMCLMQVQRVHEED